MSKLHSKLHFFLSIAGNPLPHPNIPQASPAISPSVGQNSNSEASKLANDFRLDFAISDFMVIAPDAIGEIFAQNGPSGIVVTNGSVGAHKLIGSGCALHRASGLSRLERDLGGPNTIRLEVIPNHDGQIKSRGFRRSYMPAIVDGHLALESYIGSPCDMMNRWSSICNTASEFDFFYVVFWKRRSRDLIWLRTWQKKAEQQNKLITFHFLCYL